MTRKVPPAYVSPSILIWLRSASATSSRPLRATTLRTELYVITFGSTPFKQETKERHVLREQALCFASLCFELTLQWHFQPVDGTFPTRCTSSSYSING